MRKTKFRYWDVVTEDFSISDANVVILQYVISHFYNTGQTYEIQGFFCKVGRYYN